MNSYHKIHFNSNQLNDLPNQHISLRLPSSIRGLIKSDPEAFERSFENETDPENLVLESRLNSLNSWSQEHAARYFLQTILQEQENDKLRQITTPESPTLVPNMQMTDNRYEPLTQNQVVTFDQTSHSIPIFGSRAVIEIDSDNNTLVALDASLADTPDISPRPNLAWQEALNFLLRRCGRESDMNIVVSPPKLKYYQNEENESWCLIYHFRELPLNPPEEEVEIPEDIDPHLFHGCSQAISLREMSLEHDFLVDANNGELLFWYSSAPRFAVPTPCGGIDEFGTPRQFFGLNTGAAFQLHDPQRNISTYDLDFHLIDTNAVPALPVQNNSADFNTLNTAAISAHYFATVVYDFFNNLLKRQGVDGKGMLLKSVVNVVESNTNREWANAVWWKDHMWYGQTIDPGGKLTSYSQHLDIIGHELTHGVTESTSGLIYAHLSGALNESFSDIFGILIKNWDPVTDFRPILSWDWELGPGIGRNGGPIRNFMNPTITGQPDHYRSYVKLPNTRAGDYGGVHIYSGIHNKAVYNLLSAVDLNGNSEIPPSEVAILYYLTLLRLTARADFSDCKKTLLNVVGIYYSYNNQVQIQRRQLVQRSYDSVGIL